MPDQVIVSSIRLVYNGTRAPGLVAVLRGNGNMDGRNRYERVFAAWLRRQSLIYLLVDETHRRVFAGQTVKSPDFVVYGRKGQRFVIDVKGRRYPSGNEPRPRCVWERWCTRMDCTSLLRWSDALQGQGLLVFVYHIRKGYEQACPRWLETWCWQENSYGLCGVRVEKYIEQMRLRSAKWDTVSLPMAVFRELAEPISVLLGVMEDYDLVSPGGSAVFAE